MDGKAKPFQKQSDDFTREVRREMEITVRDSLRESGSPPTPGAALPGSYTFLSPGPPYPGATLAGPRGRLRPTAPPNSEPHAPFSLELPPPLWERTGRTGTEPSPLHSEQTVEAPRSQVRTGTARSGGRQQPRFLCS